MAKGLMKCILAWPMVTSQPIPIAQHCPWSPHSQFLSHSIAHVRLTASSYRTALHMYRTWSDKRKRQLISAARDLRLLPSIRAIYGIHRHPQPPSTYCVAFQIGHTESVPDRTQAYVQKIPYNILTSRGEVSE